MIQRSLLLGLERGTVKLVEHRKEWQQLADEERSRLEDALDASVDEIEHVGSTAIEGLPAKPVLNLLAVADDPAPKAEYVARLKPEGYELRENDAVPDRLFFAKGPTEERTHYLSIAERGSVCHREQIAFRDYLRSNPDAAAEYARLKRKLATAHPDDRASYTERKSAFVTHILDRSENDR
ncbi:GrpB family protein [Natronoarchaeum rubrum]|uniref:GrpB family protein n=1 Tax=Natronoarchaeum rubrum TaxID=755311 RepID=UPI0021127BE5|nr:GrpB family protein [Natronoarchaeum rubrum]